MPVNERDRATAERENTTWGMEREFTFAELAIILRNMTTASLAEMPKPQRRTKEQAAVLREYRARRVERQEAHAEVCREQVTALYGASVRYKDSWEDGGRIRNRGTAWVLYPAKAEPEVKPEREPEVKRMAGKRKVWVTA